MTIAPKDKQLLGSVIEKVPVAVNVSGIELVALKKLSTISHALASKLGGRAADEQKTLVGVLDELVRQIEFGWVKSRVKQTEGKTP